MVVSGARYHHFQRVCAVPDWPECLAEFLFLGWAGRETWVGLDNYAELFDSDAFFTSLKNNLLWLVLFMLAPPIGLLIALFLNQQVAGIRLIKALFFFPFVISQVVVGLVFAWFYDPSFGLLTEFMTALGFEPVSILADEKLVTYGIIAAGLWPQIAYCMILYLTGLNTSTQSNWKRRVLTVQKAGACFGMWWCRNSNPPPLLRWWSL